jgi:hypothetical protein
VFFVSFVVESLDFLDVARKKQGRQCAGLVVLQGAFLGMR